ncbi:MAG: 3-phosphoshikimate 1-carboxyvinyltransferase [Lachnospiraceae bacterium]|nr:3-phosphoshikimate 1-carboxyvinyltransferase [Lachnospiraceae bacterium]
MDKFRMKPFSHPPNMQITVPGSKSITNRALLLAALSEGKSVLKGVLFSEDSRVFMQALQTLGYSVRLREEKAEVEIEGCGAMVPREKVSVYVGSAGTAARFLTAMLALSGGRYEVTASEQMKARPMRPLLLALEQLGVKFEYREKPYAFPFAICGREEADCQEVSLNIDESSQFLSALLLTGVFCPKGFRIRLTGKRDAKAYVAISMKMMEEFGCQMRQRGEQEYEILPGQCYKAREYQIEPDVSAACYFYGMAAVTGGRAVVSHVHFDSTQGDIQFLRVLEQMGCEVREEPEGIWVTGPEPGKLSGITLNMSNFSDQTMTLSAVAVFANSPTEIIGVAHIRRQESDRLRGIVTELKRLGISCEEKEDGLRLVPGEITPATIQTYEDHRMAMAFAIIGAKIPGIIIDNPLCCQKTFENYFEILTNLDLSLE